MKKIVEFLISREARKYLYSLLIAFVPFALYKGWMEPEAAPLVIGFVVALLNLSPKDTEQGYTGGGGEPIVEFDVRD